MESTLRDPTKAIAESFDRYVTLPFADMIQRASVKCRPKRSPVYGVFGPLLPHPSTDRNKTRTCSSLFPRNFPIKFGTNPSTIFLVILVTDRHTDKPTPVKTYSLAFGGDKNFWLRPCSRLLNSCRCRVTVVVYFEIFSCCICILQRQCGHVYEKVTLKVYLVRFHSVPFLFSQSIR